MTLPRRAVGSSGYGGRGYKPLGHKKSKVLPSVTTVLKAEAKPALQQWVADQTAAYAIANAHELLRMSDLKGFGLLRFFWKRQPKDAFDGAVDLSTYHTGVLADAGEMGDGVHEWIEADLFGLPFPDVTNRNAAFWQCIAAWNKFKSEHTIVPHRTEITVWNDREDGLGYAGTFDLLAEIDGVLMLIDIKTSRGLYSSTWMQLSALYEAPVMLEEGPDGVDSFIHGWQLPVEGLAVIHVRPDDDDGRDAFAKLVPMPADPGKTWRDSCASFVKSFLGLRQYMEGLKEGPKL